MEPSYVESIPSSVRRRRPRPWRHSTRFVSALRARFGRSASIGCGRQGRSTAAFTCCVSTAMAGTPEVVLFSHGCHPVTIDRRTDAGTAISADWPGRSRAACTRRGLARRSSAWVSRRRRPVVAWHQRFEDGAECRARDTSLRRCCARSPPRPPSSSAWRAGMFGCLWNRSARRTLPPRWRGPDRVRRCPGDRFRRRYAAWLRFYGAWAEAMRAQLATQPEHVSVPLAALRVNDEVWLHLPGEVFTALGQAITARSPLPRPLSRHCSAPSSAIFPIVKTSRRRICRDPCPTDTADAAVQPGGGRCPGCGALALIESLES